MAVYEGYKYKATGRKIDLGVMVKNGVSDHIRTVGCERVDFHPTITGTWTLAKFEIQTSNDGSTWQFHSRFTIDKDNPRQMTISNVHGFDRCRIKYLYRQGNPTVAMEARVS